MSRLVWLGREGGREKKERGRETDSDCVSVLESFSLSLWIFFFPKKSTFSFIARLPTLMWICTAGSPDTWNKKLHFFHDWKPFPKIIHICCSISGQGRNQNHLLKVWGLKCVKVLNKVYLLCTSWSLWGILWRFELRTYRCTVKFKGRLTGVVLWEVIAIPWILFWWLCQSSAGRQKCQALTWILQNI